jgi:conjugal transfer pilus assembly protein TraL
MKIPPHVGAASQLLGKDLDEVAVVAMIFLVGIMTSQLLISIIIMAFVSKAYKKFRGGVQEGYLLHAVYWLGFYVPSSASVINPFARDLS